jgi:hypothetical protein
MRSFHGLEAEIVYKNKKALGANNFVSEVF